MYHTDLIIVPNLSFFSSLFCGEISRCGIRLFRYVKGIGQTTPDTFFCVALACNRVNRSLSEIADVLFEIITYQKGWEYGGSSGVDA